MIQVICFYLLAIVEIFIVYPCPSKCLKANVLDLRDLKSILGDFCQHWSQVLLHYGWRKRESEGEIVTEMVGRQRWWETLHVLPGGVNKTAKLKTKQNKKETIKQYLSSNLLRDNEENCIFYGP